MSAFHDRVDQFLEERRLAAAILTVAAITGVLTVAVVAPNAIQLFAQTTKKRYRYKNKNWKRTLTRLKKAGYLNNHSKIPGAHTYSITEKGFLHLLGKIPSKSVQQSKKKWNKKWHIIMFDVDEDKRGIRNVLRRQLLHLNFTQLQKSVWINAYAPNQSILQLLQEGAKLQSVKLFYIQTDRFHGDQPILKQFGLANRLSIS